MIDTATFHAHRVVLVETGSLCACVCLSQQVHSSPKLVFHHCAVRRTQSMVVGRLIQPTSGPGYFGPRLSVPLSIPLLCYPSLCASSLSLSLHNVWPSFCWTRSKAELLPVSTRFHHTTQSAPTDLPAMLSRRHNTEPPSLEMLSSRPGPQKQTQTVPRLPGQRQCVTISNFMFFYFYFLVSVKAIVPQANFWLTP